MNVHICIHGYIHLHTPSRLKLTNTFPQKHYRFQRIHLEQEQLLPEKKVLQLFPVLVQKVDITNNGGKAKLNIR